MQKINPQLEVVVSGYEDGYDPLTRINEELAIKKKEHIRWWEGTYARYKEGLGAETDNVYGKPFLVCRLGK